MKTIRLFLSRTGDQIEETDGPAFSTTLESLVAQYGAMGERFAKAADRFVDFWNDEVAGGCIDPKARILVLYPEEMEIRFSAVLSHCETRPERTVLMVWTVGDALERRSAEIMSETGRSTEGLLLDVAGSIMLYKMHAALLGWAESTLAPSLEQPVSGALYPGFGGMLQDVMEDIERNARTEETIGVTARGTGMLHPRKTQCSFVILGQSAAARWDVALPCSPCNGVRCLYRQLGGCHLAVMGSPSPEERERRQRHEEVCRSASLGVSRERQDHGAPPPARGGPAQGDGGGAHERVRPHRRGRGHHPPGRP